MAVAGSLAWGLLSFAPMPAAGAPSGLPLHLVLVNLAYNPLLSR